jgi:hypothetical protein
MKISEIVIRPVVEAKTNSKYLGATERVAPTGPILGAKPKKQRKLMSKFFGSGS